MVKLCSTQASPQSVGRQENRKARRSYKAGIMVGEGNLVVGKWLHNDILLCAGGLVLTESKIEVQREQPGDSCSSEMQKRRGRREEEKERRIYYIPEMLRCLLVATWKVGVDVDKGGRLEEEKGF